MYSVNDYVGPGQVLARLKAQGSLFFLLLFPVWKNAIEALRHQASFMSSLYGVCFPPPV